MSQLKLAMIGMSEGNGHPYSWSAIFNGYDSVAMASCPFPVIHQYLAKEQFPNAAIREARVSHIWTQDLGLSQHIAKAAKIPNVVESWESILGEVDGILLARDDAINHVEMAKPFLEAGLPIYIDKPLALTITDAETLFALQRYPGQLFTCSAFQYARELEAIKGWGQDRKLCYIDAYIMNDWSKYAIHLIEPIVKMIGLDSSLTEVKASASEAGVECHYTFSNQLRIRLRTLKQEVVKPTIHFHSENNEQTTVVFEDTFFAFKSALKHFVQGIQEKNEQTKKPFVMRCVEMIERAASQL